MRKTAAADSRASWQFGKPLLTLAAPLPSIALSFVRCRLCCYIYLILFVFLFSRPYFLSLEHLKEAQLQNKQINNKQTTESWPTTMEIGSPVGGQHRMTARPNALPLLLRAASMIARDLSADLNAAIGMDKSLDSLVQSVQSK